MPGAAGPGADAGAVNAPAVGSGLLHGARVVAALVLTGVAVGVVWWLVAPRAQVRIESDGGYFLDPHPEQYVAGDAVFGLISLAAGLVAGILVWRFSRRRPMAAVVGLAAGGLAGALVARWVGLYLGRVDEQALVHEPTGSIVSVALSLTAVGLVLVLPLAALVAWLVCDLVADRRRGGGSGRGDP